MTGPGTPVPIESWKHYGNAGHFICGAWCRFHLCTEIGPYLVSTVGDYHSPLQIYRSGERTTMQEIGFGRFFETTVFRTTGDRCKEAACGCDMPTIIPTELDFEGYNTAGAATVGHWAMCKKIAERGVAEESPST